ncbi:hypothetical protein [Wolbachia endosymbiont of Oedothorax gibbosus]|nr:hypothetical protein [Wolbachia endosymbiont of Oedothorax gibbosus]
MNTFSIMIRGLAEDVKEVFSFLNALPKVCYARMHSISHRFI